MSTYLRRILVTAMALATVVGLAAKPARADLIPAGKQVVQATFEVVGIGAHERYLIVAFPFGACFPDDPDYFRLNPQHDRAERNYEVLREGKRYQVQKFCGNMRLYAFEKKHFATRVEKLERALDWYRKKGEALTIIEGFDQLRTTEKRALVDRDPRIRRSGFQVALPLVVDSPSATRGTHDVLAIAKLDERQMRVEGRTLELLLDSGRTLVRPYHQGRRPSAQVHRRDADRASTKERPRSERPKPAAHPETRAAAAGRLTAPAETGSGQLALALGLTAVVVTFGGAFALRRRRQ
ncbi:MAG: hypothetical protein JRI23_35395 [Deltaproteobacteria bacterium]|jgi:hypothetical protein|nr:hypothetical protein [Deltaproteobacteria bacterium]MBW2537614.1 hypothetical protein [Deltaproteobacteria bacterium]